MSSPVTAVRPATPVKEATALLADNGFTALPGVDDGDALVGVVTEADLVRDRVPRDPRSLCHPGGADEKPVTTTVGEVMTAPVVAVGPGTDVAALATALLEAGHRVMPVADGAGSSASSPAVTSCA